MLQDQKFIAVHLLVVDHEALKQEQGKQATFWD